MVDDRRPLRVEQLRIPVDESLRRPPRAGSSLPGESYPHGVLRGKRLDRYVVNLLPQQERPQVISDCVARVSTSVCDETAVHHLERTEEGGLEPQVADAMRQSDPARSSYDDRARVLSTTEEDHMGARRRCQPAQRLEEEFRIRIERLPTSALDEQSPCGEQRLHLDLRPAAPPPPHTQHP